MIAFDPALRIERARVTGAGASRDLLTEGLAAVPLAALGLGGEELLLLPRHRSRVLLRRTVDGRVHPDIGRGLGRELTSALAAAVVDPPPGTRAPAYRFTSPHRHALWLLGTWVQGGASALDLGVEQPLSWARRAFLDDGQALVVVFAGLAKGGLASRVLARLDPADTGRMRRALARSHGLPRGPSREEGSAGLGLSPAVRGLVTELRTGLAASREAGEDLSPLPTDAVELLLILPRLRSEPATPRAALAVAARVAATSPISADVSRRLPAPASTSATDAPAPPPPPGSAPTNGPPGRASAPPPVRRPPEAAQRSPVLPPPRAREPGPERHGPSANAPPAPGPWSPPPVPLATQPGATGAPDALNAPDAALPVVVGFPTAYAGLWFLCNAFLSLGLYGDFSRPQDNALAMAPSRLLDRLALGWFGALYGDDALHRALARDGGDPPLPRRWQVRPAWLDAFDTKEGASGSGARRRRPRWHPAGFPLADGPGSARDRHPRRTGRPSRRGSHPPAPRGGVAAWRRARRLPSRPEERWLACLALYLEARIQRATGDAALGLSSLAIPGHCRLGPERIDVDLALADLPLPLRMAGLDRDPGWLPSEGRSIAFHFA